ncbi:MAG: hypothetical protein JWR81_2726 [Pseudonocardia sp.]|nr:hypothetical protein [Pseudonocardia sp.]
MPTIRPHAGRVAELFLDDARAGGIDLADVALYFSTDPPLPAGAPTVDGTGLRLVRHVDGERRRALARELAARCDVDPGVLERAVVRRGYASARNAALVEAVLDGNDVAVFVDDDVHPLGGFLPSHLAGLAAGDDVTRGGYLGHSAPLVDLAPLLPEVCRVELGRALSLGNEVLPPDCLTAPGRTAGEPARGLVVYGGNVGLSLAALTGGRLPAFFCPPGARGEDTFFGLLLAGRARVGSGAAPVLHDPFRLGVGAEGARVEPTPAALRRFAGAVRGWVCYAPLWVRTQHDDPAAGDAVLRTIATIYAGHASCLAVLGLADVPDVLAAAVAAAEAELALMQAVDRAWRGTLMPALAASAA